MTHGEINIIGTNISTQTDTKNTSCVFFCSYFRSTSYPSSQRTRHLTSDEHIVQHFLTEVTAIKKANIARTKMTIKT
jgi:hypothetical protein